VELDPGDRRVKLWRAQPKFFVVAKPYGGLP
jgi:hypothetical protein